MASSDMETLLLPGSVPTQETTAKRKPLDQQWDEYVAHYHITLNLGYEKVLWNYDEYGNFRVVGGEGGRKGGRHHFTDEEKRKLFSQDLTVKQQRQKDL